MKKPQLIAVAVVGALVASAIALEFFGPDPSRGRLSAAQNEIRATLGEPSNFVLSYVPRGDDGEQLVRYETWFYPSHGRSVTFFAGSIVSTDEMPFEAPGETEYSGIRPDELDLTTTYADIQGMVGGAAIERVDFLPELFLEGEVETYMTDHLIFTLEGGSLVYAQTVGTLQ